MVVNPEHRKHFNDQCCGFDTTGQHKKDNCNAPGDRGLALGCFFLSIVPELFNIKGVPALTFVCWLLYVKCCWKNKFM
jgi:hypothetical protein